LSELIFVKPMKNNYLLFFFLFITSVVRAQGFDQYPINEWKMLSQLFDSQEFVEAFDGVHVAWKPSEEEKASLLKRFEKYKFTNEFYYARLNNAYLFKQYKKGEQEVFELVLVFYSDLLTDFEGEYFIENCHACAPIISLAHVRITGKDADAKVETLKFERAIGVYGEWGFASEHHALDYGASHKAIAFTEVWSGDEKNYAVLHLYDMETLQPILHLTLESYYEKPDNRLTVHEHTTFEFDKTNSAQSPYPIVVERIFTEQLSGESTTVSKKEKLNLSFEKGAYQFPK